MPPPAHALSPGSQWTINATVAGNFGCGVQTLEPDGNFSMAGTTLDLYAAGNDQISESWSEAIPTIDGLITFKFTFDGTWVPIHQQYEGPFTFNAFGGEIFAGTLVPGGNCGSPVF
jgi:hypothetical protein